MVIERGEELTQFSIENTKKYTDNEIKNIFKNLNTEKWIGLKKNIYASFKGHILISDKDTNTLTVMINRIIKNAPSFDLKTFLKDEITFLELQAHNDEDFVYNDAFFKKLDSKISEAEQSFKTRIVNIFKQKAINIAEKFGIINPEVALSNLFHNLEILRDPQFDRSEINTIFKKISDEMETDGLQIPGLSGIYEPIIFNEKMDTDLNKLGVCIPNPNKSDSSIKKQTDTLSRYIISYIADYYRKKTNDAATPASIELKNIELNKTDRTTDRLDILEKLIPGTKILLSPLLKHNDDKYGSLRIDINEKNNRQLADVTATWNYDGINTIVYARDDVKVVDTKTPVETAYDLINKYYQDDNLLPSTNFEIPAIINAFETNFNTLINSLSGKRWNEITESQLRKLAENAMIVNPESKIVEKVNKLLSRIAEIKRNVDVDIKIEYSSPSYINQFLKFKLNIIEKEAKAILPERKSFNLSTNGYIIKDNFNTVNTMLFSYPNQILGEIFNDSKRPTPTEQDFVNYNEGASLNDKYFFNELDFGKKIKLTLERWKNYGYNNIDINNSVRRVVDNALETVYTLNVTINDENMESNSETNKNSMKNYSYVFRVKSIEEQLKPIWDSLLKFGGKKDTIFDPKVYPDPENPTGAYVYDGNGLSKLLINHDGTTTLNQAIEKNLPKGADIQFGYIYVLDATYPPDKKERGLGLSWTIYLRRQDIFGDNNISMHSGIINNYVYEYNKMKPAYIENAKNKVKRVRDSSIAIAKTKLTNYKKIDDKINTKINEMDNIYNGFIKNINNMQEKLRLSKVILDNMEVEAINKILAKLKSIMNFDVNTLKTMEEISKITGHKLTPKQIQAINDYPKLFQELLKITKKKSVIERLLNDPSLLKNMNKYIKSHVFKKTLDAIIKSESYYKYGYFGTGVASGVVAVGAGAAALSSINAKRKLAKISTKKAKIRGGKLVAWITTLIALSAIGISVGTELWFFIAEGGF